MKHQFICRAIALALALFLALTAVLSLTAPGYADPDTTESESESGSPDPSQTGEDEDDEDDEDDDDGDDDDDDNDDDKTVSVTGVSLSETKLTLEVGEEATLTATVSPENATNKTVNWASDKPVIATVENGKVTAKSEGTAIITVTTADGNETANCTVTVNAPDPVITISGPNPMIWNSKTTDRNLRASVTYPVPGAEVRWRVEYVPGKDYTNLPKFKGPDESLSDEGTGEIVTIADNGAGDFIFTASYVAEDGTILAGPVTKRLTISGIILSGDGLEAEEDSMRMYVGNRTTLTVEAFGDAANNNNSTLEWSSSDSSVASVMNNNGNLIAWSVGKAVITATKGDYSASCTVEVVEDTSVIADQNLAGRKFTATFSKPLIFWNKDADLDVGLYAKLNSICLTKTAEYGEYADTDKKTGFGLSYITNLSVSPNQGTLYYNYSTESDTGSGVAYTDQFAQTASGSRRGMDRLYFVPKSGFTGTAEISFSAIAANGRNISGVIRVEVGADAGSSGGGTHQISYRARAGEPVPFLSEDFNAYCQGRTGRDYNSITFNLPKSSEGVLYYNYVAGSGNQVSTTIQFTPSGRYTIGDVCFVPNSGYEGEVTISFRAVDTAGEIINGTLTVEVTAASADGDSANVTISGERGRPVTLLSSVFNAACQATIYDKLSYVTFKLPDQAEGTLYYNYRSDGTYDSRVTATTRYYYSGVPGLGSVSFVPATNAAGRVAISYTGYGAGGASFSGTLYIELEEVDRSTIHYSVAEGGSVTFSASDFNTAGQHTVGSNVSFVVFKKISGAASNTLRYRNSNTSNVMVGTSPNLTSFTTSYVYYVNPTGSQRGLNRVYFDVRDTAVDTVTIEYAAYSGTATSSSRQKLFEGEVVIRIGALTPEDIELSCETGGQADLSASDVSGVCDAVMSQSLSYIEITSVPDAKAGHLYFGYNYKDYGSGRVVKAGDRFYRTGSDNISDLTFVPFARFDGKTEIAITYIGYSSDGQEQVSGRIVVNVTQSTDSLYFDDVKDNYSWAADSADYLYRNGTVLGVGGDLYDPGGIIRRGDFALMLVRAYKLTANGSASFSDVPADMYYADAVRIAYQLGIVNSSDGKFYPEDALIRQDAMVMIYNVLKVKGKTTTNGLAADLSAYYDEGEIDADAREAMGNLVQMGVVQGDGSGYLTPKSQLNRAQAAILLHTIMTL